jgi:hypothetical protein
LPERYRSSCIAGFSNSLAKNGIPGEEERGVISFCEQVKEKLPGEAHSCALRTLGFFKGTRSPEAFSRLCASFEKKFGITCEAVSLD